ncbi:MAG: helix-turn-helix transcriptional regulator [Bacteroidota bacterium]|nr:helix-turn-helix transcriptional regulator [Bacteroidota bacterium]
MKTLKPTTMSFENEQMVNELESLLSFNNKEEKMELEAELLHLKFIKVIEEAMKLEGISKAEIAAQLATSKSYITQLFSGDKLLNMKMLARLQQVLDISFQIDAERKKPVFKAVDCGVFKTTYTLNSINPHMKGLKYRINTTESKLKLVG